MQKEIFTYFRSSVSISSKMCQHYIMVPYTVRLPEILITTDDCNLSADVNCSHVVHDLINSMLCLLHLVAPCQQVSIRFLHFSCYPILNARHELVIRQRNLRIFVYLKEFKHIIILLQNIDLFLLLMLKQTFDNYFQIPV